MDPFTGEIRMFAFSWAPVKWSTCDGQEITISSNGALYALIGSQFGGNDSSFFNLPDFRGRTPVGTGGSYSQGEKFGVESVVLDQSTMAAHTHHFNASAEDGERQNAATGDCCLASVIDRGTTYPGVELYGSASNLVNLGEGIVSATSGGQSHTNLQPSQVINFCICTDGIFPSRN